MLVSETTQLINSLTEEESKAANAVQTTKLPY